MRVLLITDWNPLSGGAEIYLQTLRSGLRAAGDDVFLLTSDVSAEARRVADGTAWASDSVIARAGLQIANPFSAHAVRRAVGELRPEVALVNMFSLFLSPSAVFALGAVPTVHLVSDYKIVCPTGAKLLPGGAVCTRSAGRTCLDAGCLTRAHWARDQIRYARIRQAIARADLVLACSRSVQRILAADGIASEVEELPVSLEEGPAGEADPAPTFVYVGRLDAEKGVDTLLLAFALVRRRVPNARLRVVGRGSRQDDLVEMTNRLGCADATTFVGWCAPGDVGRELDRAWALVAPSRWVEPQGLVVPEAIVRGVPVIVTDHGGLAEQVEPEVDGLLVPPDDVSALAAAMERVARGDAFPHRRLPVDVVDRCRRRHDVGAHVARLRRRFSEMLSA